MRARGALVLLGVLLLVGCPSGKSSPPATSSAIVLTFADEAAILAADATSAPVASAIFAVGTSRSQKLSMRETALQKLREQAPASAVVLAGDLLESPFRGSNDEALRRDAVVALVAIGTPDALAALERGKKNDLDVGVLAARLTRRKEGK